MRFIKRGLAALLAAGAVCAIAAPASAASFVGNAGTLNTAPGDVTGFTFPKVIAASNTYFIKFFLPLAEQLQTGLAINYTKAGVPTGAPLTFALYSGGVCSATVCSGGALVDAVLAPVVNPALSDALLAGNYYVKLTSTVLPAGPFDNGPTLSATFTVPSAVPEPTAWSMMILGLGSIGAVLRTSRRRNMAMVSA
jgi:hypothetical protein